MTRDVGAYQAASGPVGSPWPSSLSKTASGGGSTVTLPALQAHPTAAGLVGNVLGIRVRVRANTQCQ